MLSRTFGPNSSQTIKTLYFRSNEQLQNTVNEQSDRIRDFVYRQMRDSELINELKNDVSFYHVRNIKEQVILIFVQ